MATIYVSSDNLVTLAGLYDNVSASFIDNATVAGTVLDPGAGNAPVPGSAFTPTYVAASTGNYQGQIPATVAAILIPNQYYIVQLTITVGGLTLVMRDTFVANYAG